MSTHSAKPVRRDISGGDPVVEVAEVVAELHEIDATELDPLYQYVDQMLHAVVSNPPVPEAQVKVTFQYEGLHITVGQDGIATFVRSE